MVYGLRASWHLLVPLSSQIIHANACVSILFLESFLKFAVFIIVLYVNVDRASRASGKSFIPGSLVLCFLIMSNSA